MRVLITGGAGFIGANLTARLEADGIDCVVLDDLSTGFAKNLDGTAAEFVEGSILDDDILDRVLPGVTAVVHLAARPSVPRSLADPLRTHTVNATGTLTLLEAVRRHDIGQVIAASSSSVYGATPTLPKAEDLPTRPMSPYAASKLAAESYVLAHQAAFGLPALVFRFFNVFGPLQAAGHAYAAVVPTFIDAALSGTAVQVHGDGLQSRDFTYVGSVTRVLADAVTRQVTHTDPVNLAFGSRRTVLDALSGIETLLGTEVARTHTDARPGDVRHSEADTTTLTSLFPDIAPTPFEDGLADTIDWYRRLRE